MRPRSRIALRLSVVFMVVLLAVLFLLGLSLGEFSDLGTTRSLRTLAYAAAAVLLSGALVWYLAARLLEIRIRALSEGMKRLGEEDFGFRFPVDETDDFSPLTKAFNLMAVKLEASLSALRETRDYFEGIVENSADLIITVNPRGYVYTFNRGAEAILGYSRTEMIGRNIEQIFATPEEQARAQNRLRGHENVQNFETRLKTKDGEIREAILTLSRLRDADGRMIGTFGVGKDVTDLNAMQRKLLHAERFAAIGEAVAGIQHSMKNMLNALKGGSYMVRLGVKKEDWKLLGEGWQMVEEGIENLSGMSAHMLSYLRDYQPEFDRVDLAGMVREIEEMFRPTVEERGVRLAVEATDGAAEVHCDGRLIHTVVVDILSNALDACMEKPYPEGETPEIRVTAGLLDGEETFALSIRDNGCGMSPEVKSRVFAPFFSTKKKSGTGLGLALTARTIRLHGGEIEVDSRPDEGAEFRILLPMRGPEGAKES
jgi:PAS domain S-box-containing protein